MIHFKQDVALKKLTPALYWMLHCLCEMDGDYTVTSINDGLHSTSPLSRHYTDEAIDVRSHDIPSNEQKLQFLNNYGRLLNESEDCIKKHSFFLMLEASGTPNEHFHIQVRKGETYP